MASAFKNQFYSNSDGCCIYCGYPVDPDYWHLEHKIPRRYYGGTNDISNLGISCPTCNLRKGCRTPEDFKEHIKDKLIQSLGKYAIDDGFEYISCYFDKASFDEIRKKYTEFIEFILNSDITFHFEEGSDGEL